MTLTNNFDRIGDWKEFSNRMEEYLQRPIKKYGGKQQMNDLLHYTGLRVMAWNILKYAMRLWLGNSKEHDLEKVAHYAQMFWTLAQQKSLKAPFFKEDSNEDYILTREIIPTKRKISYFRVFIYKWTKQASLKIPVTPADCLVDINNIVALDIVEEKAREEALIKVDKKPSLFKDLKTLIKEITEKEGKRKFYLDPSPLVVQSYPIYEDEIDPIKD